MSGGATHRPRPAESVWDYPRPPRVEDAERHILVRRGEEILAETHRALRVLETSHPPVFYVRPDDVVMSLLRPNRRKTVCEFKGTATYWDLTTPPVEPAVAWSYDRPASGFASITGWLAFYPSKIECFVDGQRAAAQAGDFYGGWITPEIEGPFKGGPGTWGW